MMMTLQNSLNQVVDQIIDLKLERQEEIFIQKMNELEQKILSSTNSGTHEILQQKEVFELLGIGRKRLKKWVDRGLLEMRIDNRVYYRYSDIMRFITNSND